MSNKRTYGKFLDHCSISGIIYYPGAGKDLGAMLEFYESNSDKWSIPGDRYTGSRFICKSKKNKNRPVFVMLDREPEALDYVAREFLQNGEYYNGFISEHERSGR